MRSDAFDVGRSVAAWGWQRPDVMARRTAAQLTSDTFHIGLGLII